MVDKNLPIMDEIMKKYVKNKAYKKTKKRM